MSSNGDVIVVQVVDSQQARKAIVVVPWPLSARDAGTTAAGAAALLLVAPERVSVHSLALGSPRPLAETLRAVAAAIREIPPVPSVEPTELALAGAGA